jgi:hypothetical protein
MQLEKTHIFRKKSKFFHENAKKSLVRLENRILQERLPCG